MLPSELKLAGLGHCYVHLPSAFISKEQYVKAGDTISIRSVQSDTELYVTWNGQLSEGRFVNLDLTFGRANGFSDELVVITLVKDLELSECSTCLVELVEASDYSIINQHLDANVLDTCKLISKGLVIPIWLSQNVKVLVKVSNYKPDKSFVLLNKWTQMQFQHSLDNVPTPKEVDTEDNIPIENPMPLISCSLGIEYKPLFVLGSLLICGDRGSGKTHFLKSTLENYRKFNSEYFNCKQLRGKRPESVKKKFDELLKEALDKQPSILALDDIDSFASVDSKHEDDKGLDVIYRKRLVDIFCSLFKHLERSEHTEGQRVVILSTCNSFESLDLRILKPKGRKYFTKVIRIGNPNLNERMEILKNIVAEHKQVQTGLDSCQYETIAKKCASYMPLDLRRLVERGIISACARSSGFDSEPLKLQIEDLDEALNNHVPSNLRGMALQKKSVKTFDNVGGMMKIKDTLMKTILLQVKYPKIFSKCPVKPQTSILLHGPPGCGKTLIAEALTNQDCVNSICVRGPELLSKYIGASEAAVRDLFKRAELAKPCVIFFDEFESLVSKRGADSTGVTDRIVNQFLTILDGVEKLSGNIFILATSSRPDMIDPAILRPGRLDKHIYCPLPDQGDRFEILKVLSHDIEIENQDLFLEEWPSKLEGFTGADLQAFLYSAQLKALHEALDTLENIKNKDGTKKAKDMTIKSPVDVDIVVKQAHIEESFNEMRQEVAARYVSILNQYTGSIRGSNNQVAQRATLA